MLSLRPTSAVAMWKFSFGLKTWLKSLKFYASESAFIATETSVTWRSQEEPLAKYRAGGYHPVSLGDTFNGRYTVLQKLGFGQYSTVWLASDAR
jgi:hypothetical protein